MDAEYVARFWAKVDRKGPDDCWEWTGFRDRQGYGRFAGRIPGKNAVWTASRLSWTLANGPIPAGMYVCHRCDNPPCVNPAHLFLGTQRENFDDMMRKGRLPRRVGSKTPFVKLTEPLVIDIKRRLAARERRKDIAARYNVCIATIDHIAQGRTWSHVS